MLIVFVLALLVVGLVAGFVTRAVVPDMDTMSLPASIALGILGSVVGGVVLGLLAGGVHNPGFGPAGLLGSIVGAVVALLVVNRFVSDGGDMRA